MATHGLTDRDGDHTQGAVVVQCAYIGRHAQGLLIEAGGAVGGGELGEIDGDRKVGATSQQRVVIHQYLVVDLIAAGRGKQFQRRWRDADGGGAVLPVDLAGD